MATGARAETERQWARDNVSRRSEEAGEGQRTCLRGCDWKRTIDCRAHFLAGAHCSAASPVRRSSSFGAGAGFSQAQRLSPAQPMRAALHAVGVELTLVRRVRCPSCSRANRELGAGVCVRGQGPSESDEREDLPDDVDSSHKPMATWVSPSPSPPPCSRSSLAARLRPQQQQPPRVTPTPDKRASSLPAPRSQDRGRHRWRRWLLTRRERWGSLACGLAAVCALCSLSLCLVSSLALTPERATGLAANAEHPSRRARTRQDKDTPGKHAQ